MTEKFSLIRKKIMAWIRALHFRLGENPSRDWLLILATFLLLCGLIVPFTLTSYESLKAVERKANNVATSSPSSLNRELITRVVSYYEGRRGAQQDLLKNPSVLVDPSK